jgi:hypothetical protein
MNNEQMLVTKKIKQNATAAMEKTKRTKNIDFN